MRSDPSWRGAGPFSSHPMPKQQLSNRAMDCCGMIFFFDAMEWNIMESNIFGNCSQKTPKTWNGSEQSLIPRSVGAMSCPVPSCNAGHAVGSVSYLECCMRQPATAVADRVSLSVRHLGAGFLVSGNIISDAVFKQSPQRNKFELDQIVALIFKSGITETSSSRLL
mmetsp:Transcript_8417/g.24882  ORF Transcript_8417/g.24882 Transcript_8417/m.24882 type:complete len:166 (-) Transcript_8417:1-498(-)